MFDFPRIGVAIFIQKGDQFLFGKRRGSHGEGTWSIPGGHLEKYESPEECAKREAFEETGLCIENARLLTVTNDVFRNDQKHYITLFMITESFTGVPVSIEPDKFTDLQWLGWSDVPENIFLPLENLKKNGINPLANNHAKTFTF